MDMVIDTFPQYRLWKSKLLEYLRQQFPAYSDAISVEVSINDKTFVERIDKGEGARHCLSPHDPPEVNYVKMADSHHLAEFEESLSKFGDYPRNLTRTVDFPYTLDAYHSKLVEDEQLYFGDRRPRIRIWDLVKPQDGP
ncbi:hypothetical protein N0V84_001859 [Fusarium piperis]|uniref:CorA-like transporter domain-containing protein n=1 Tax=Fusarium piperis TaxID=1435070 RepID=A0A9W8WKE9_9HYPO|nr:hypothetical protein N0V84_001859 [Fusarium piperis]